MECCQMNILKVQDGSTWSLNRNCNQYKKPLDNVSHRYLKELHDTIDTIECDDFSKQEVKDKYIKLKNPVKIKNCKTPEVKLKNNFKWQGLILQKGAGHSINMMEIEESERKRLVDNGFLLKVGSCVMKLKSLEIQQNF